MTEPTGLETIVQGKILSPFTRLRRLLEIVPAPLATPNTSVLPFARHLRSPSQYALPFTRKTQGEDA